VDRASLEQRGWEATENHEAAAVRVAQGCYLKLIRSFNKTAVFTGASAPVGARNRN
jgi:hypothetical protein